MEVGDGEQQAFEEVQIAPSANSSVSMDKVYAEERAHVDPASTESHAHELEMHAEQWVLQQAAYSEQLASASDVNAEERTRQARVHAEQRVLQEGESLDPEPLVGDTPCIRQLTWEEPAGEYDGARQIWWCGSGSSCRYGSTGNHHESWVADKNWLARQLWRNSDAKERQERLCHARLCVETCGLSAGWKEVLLWHRGGWHKWCTYFGDWFFSSCRVGDVFLIAQSRFLQ